jgi:hypothetical protein
MDMEMGLLLGVCGFVVAVLYAIWSSGGQI